MHKGSGGLLYDGIAVGVLLRLIEVKGSVVGTTVGVVVVVVVEVVVVVVAVVVEIVVVDVVVLMVIISVIRWVDDEEHGELTCDLMRFEVSRLLNNDHQ